LNLSINWNELSLGPQNLESFVLEVGFFVILPLSIIDLKPEIQLAKRRRQRWRKTGYVFSFSLLAGGGAAGRTFV